MKVLVVLIMLALLTGCATNKPLTALPESKVDYALNKEALFAKYPDIPAYEKTWRGFSPNFPPEQNILNHLGEPKKIERDWSYPILMVGTLVVINAHPVTWGIVLTIRPDTPKKYYFEKEEYCVETIIDRTIINGYEPYMTSWNWDKSKEKRFLRKSVKHMLFQHSIWRLRARIGMNPWSRD